MIHQINHTFLLYSNGQSLGISGEVKYPPGQNKLRKSDKFTIPKSLSLQKKNECLDSFQLLT